MNEHSEAARIAGQAGELLLELRERGDLADKELRDEADRQAHELIMGLLAEAYPDDAVLSEEGADDTRRLEHSRVWVVDPLDGTREYAEGRSDWAVHVALVTDEIASIGAVALPALRQRSPHPGDHRRPPPRPRPDARAIRGRARGCAGRRQLRHPRQLRGVAAGALGRRGGDDGVRQLGPADQQVGQVQVGLVVGQG